MPSTEIYPSICLYQNHVFRDKTNALINYVGCIISGIQFITNPGLKDFTVMVGMVYGNMISDLLLEGFKVDNQQVFHLPQKKEQKKKVSDVLIS